MGTGSAAGGEEPSRAGIKWKADGEHPEDLDHEDGKWVRTEENKRMSVEEEEENMLKKIVQYLKTLGKAEAKKTSEVTQEVVEVNEEEDE